MDITGLKLFLNLKHLSYAFGDIIRIYLDALTHKTFNSHRKQKYFCLKINIDFLFLYLRFCELTKL